MCRSRGLWIDLQLPCLLAPQFNIIDPLGSVHDQLETGRVIAPMIILLIQISSCHILAFIYKSFGIICTIFNEYPHASPPSPFLNQKAGLLSHIRITMHTYETT